MPKAVYTTSKIQRKLYERPYLRLCQWLSPIKDFVVYHDGAVMLFWQWRFGGSSFDVGRGL